MIAWSKLHINRKKRNYFQAVCFGPGPYLFINPGATVQWGMSWLFEIPDRYLTSFRKNNACQNYFVSPFFYSFFKESTGFVMAALMD